MSTGGPDDWALCAEEEGMCRLVHSASTRRARRQAGWHHSVRVKIVAGGVVICSGALPAGVVRVGPPTPAPPSSGSCTAAQPDPD